MKCDVWKPCSDQRWQDELRFSIWRFFEQSSFVNVHLLCYWPTIHNSKICPKFQVISSHFFEVEELLDEHWAKIVQSKNIPTNSNLYRMRYDVSIKGLRSRNLVFRVWPWYSTWKILAQQSCMPKNGLQMAKYGEWYTVFFEHLIRTYGWLVKTGCRDSGDMGSISAHSAEC